MTEQTPTIQTADKDGEGPAKRRRRPALSCVECRSRKVKCDREKPCGACTRLRSTTCTYRPHRVGVRERSPTSGNNNQDHRDSARSSPQPYMPANQFDTIINKYVAPGILGEHGRPGPLPAGRLNLSLDSRTNSGDSPLIKSLLDRIQSLENNEASKEGRSSYTHLPVNQDSDTGQFVKSKYYGQSHWMNAIDPVRFS
jgi:hypothetical protein